MSRRPLLVGLLFYGLILIVAKEARAEAVTGERTRLVRPPGVAAMFRVSAVRGAVRGLWARTQHVVRTYGAGRAARRAADRAIEARNTRWDRARAAEAALDLSDPLALKGASAILRDEWLYVKGAPDEPDSWVTRQREKIEERVDRVTPGLVGALRGAKRDARDGRRPVLERLESFERFVYLAATAASLKEIQTNTKYLYPSAQWLRQVADTIAEELSTVLVGYCADKPAARVKVLEALERVRELTEDIAPRASAQMEDAARAVRMHVERENRRYAALRARFGLPESTLPYLAK